jgi:hypothetical protein
LCDKRYLVDEKLYGFDNHHCNAGVDENEVCDDDGSCAGDISEKAYTGVYGVEGVSDDVEGKVVKGETFDTGSYYAYDFNL